MGIIGYAHNLKLNDDGIWQAAECQSVSYPEDGHARCFQIEDASFWFQHRNDCIVAAIKRFPPSGCILEIGGGNGYTARRLVDEGFECALLEPGIDGALNARRRRNISEVICSTLEAAKFEREALPAVGMFDVIEHIQDDRMLVDEIHDVLQPKGLFYCTIPTYQWLWSKHDVTAGHFRRYNHATIEQLFSGRFEVLYFSHFFSALVMPLFLFKALPFKLFGARSVLTQQQEHGIQGGLNVAILRWLLKNEAGKVRRGLHIPTGTSGLIVARKI